MCGLDCLVSININDSSTRVYYKFGLFDNLRLNLQVVSVFSKTDVISDSTRHLALEDIEEQNDDYLVRGTSLI